MPTQVRKKKHRKGISGCWAGGGAVQVRLVGGWAEAAMASSATGAAPHECGVGASCLPLLARSQWASHPESQKKINQPGVRKACPTGVMAGQHGCCKCPHCTEMGHPMGKKQHAPKGVSSARWFCQAVCGKLNQPQCTLALHLGAIPLAVVHIGHHALSSMRLVAPQGHTVSQSRPGAILPREQVLSRGGSL